MTRAPGADVLDAVGAHLEGHPPEGTALIACSGGIDSTVLASVLTPLLKGRGVSVWLVHLDHGLRGRGAAADASAVRTLAKELGVPSFSRTRLPDFAAVREVGLQAAARAIRRELLFAVAKMLGASVCYLAHHEDDQVETLVIQERRGRLSRSRGGIAEVSGLLERPLLRVRRREIQSLAVVRGWSWRTDPSNTDSRFLRAAVRSEPPLTPSVRAGLLKRALNVRARRTYLHQEAARVQDSMVTTRQEGRVVLRRVHLARLRDEVAIVLLQRHTPNPGGRPPSRAALRGLMACVRRGTGGERRKLTLGGGWRAEVCGPDVSLLRGDVRAASAPGFDLVVTSMDVETARTLCSSTSARANSYAIFDCSVVADGLRRGEVGVGRRMKLQGGSGRRLLRDLLAEAGVPAELRSSWPVVELPDGEVVWVPGVRRSAHRLLTEASAEALVLYTVAPRVDENGALERIL